MSDFEVLSIMKKYEDLVVFIKVEVVGKLFIDLVKGYFFNGVIGDIVFGNLIVDGMKVEMNVDFVLMNGGGVCL